MRVTIALLVVYALTLLIEVPIGVYTLINRFGAASAIGPGAIEAIFLALMIVFIFYAGRAMRWSYLGAIVVGIAHTFLSASVVMMEPWGEWLDFYVNATSPPELIHRVTVGLPAIAVFLTVLPALLAIAAALAVLELRKRAPS